MTIHSTAHSGWQQISKFIINVLIAGLCKGNPLVTRRFPSQMTSNVEIISLLWHHYVWGFQVDFLYCSDSLNVSYWIEWSDDRIVGRSATRLLIATELTLNCRSHFSFISHIILYRNIPDTKKQLWQLLSRINMIICQELRPKSTILGVVIENIKTFSAFRIQCLKLLFSPPKISSSWLLTTFTYTSNNHGYSLYASVKFSHLELAKLNVHNTASKNVWERNG